MNSVIVELDAKGRCCGKKPLSYKRKGHLFCGRCNAQFGIEDGKQQPNWAWRQCGVGFQPVYRIQPTGSVAGGYRKFMEALGLPLPAIRWQHKCPSLGEHRHTNEHHASFLKCRCWSTPDFLAAQDALAVKLDLERGASE